MSIRSSPAERSPEEPTNHWPLQDAKAHFSEVVRRVRSDGPQHVTVRGRDEVVMISAAEYRRLTGGETGQALIDAMRACPDPDFDFGAPGTPMPVRDVDL